MVLRKLDLDELRRDFASAKPYPFVRIEQLLEPAFAEEVALAYPSFESATTRGRTFSAVNERRKVQITDAKSFPNPVRALNEALASKTFLQDLSYVTGIPELLADEELLGGGMHITGPGGRLDVHVDFNYVPQRELYRRINLLLYLNPIWQDDWGGHIQLWDRHVRHCEHSFVPRLNFCLIFETSDISFHGVVPVNTAAPFPRLSFATYYYTRSAPIGWRGTVHSTVFKARPEERMRRYVLMPAEKAHRGLRYAIRRLKNSLK